MTLIGSLLLSSLGLGVAATGGTAAATGGTADGETSPSGVGVVSDLTWYMSRPDMDRSIAMMKAAGVQWVRASMNWSTVEPDTKGVLSSWWMPELDYAIGQAQAAGLKVLMPISDGVPYWASADPAKYEDASGRHWNIHWKPANISDYVDIVSVIVTRYAALGVHHYEVWNEPNYVRFWPSGPSAPEYTAMLKATYPAIKQADPSATVVMGGLSGNDYTFLEAMYAAGALGSFDVAAVHPYTHDDDPTLCWYEPGTSRNAKFAFCGIEEVRRTMLANGDSRSIWLTEMGWSTSAVANGVSETTQADYLAKAFAAVEQYPYVTNTFWYSFRSNWWSNNDPADLEANYGLVAVDFTPKPAYAALKAYAGAAASTTPTTVPVADTASPVLTGLRAEAIGRSAATIAWASNESADSAVDHWVVGTTRVSTVRVTASVVAHRIGLEGLQRRTTYNYRVRSVDAAGNTGVSAVLSFTTR